VCKSFTVNPKSTSTASRAATAVDVPTVGAPVVDAAAVDAAALGAPIDQTSPLDDMVCFALYAAARATNRRYLALLAPWGLTYPQYLVLVLLWNHPSLTVGEVAERLMLDSGTTSPLIRRLEARGFLTRSRSSSDERVVTVAPTEAGVALRSELAHIPACIAEATQLDLADHGDALALLHGVTSSLAESLVRSPATERTPSTLPAAPAPAA
jgi:DNA-binding MarR family transcriptional regulator